MNLRTRSFRRLALVAMLVALFAVLAVSLVQAQVTEIRFGILQGPPVEPVTALMVDQFNASHPDVTVKIEYLTGDIAAGLAAQAAAGTLPDVVFLADLFVVPFVQGGIVLDMQSLADTDEEFDISDVYENMLNLSRVNGEGLYMIPSSYDVVTMYYNKTMFEAAGAPLPEADWTWDQFIAACRTIRENTDNYCLTNTGWNWWAWYVPWIVGYGGDVLADDGKTSMLASPESLAGLEAYVKMWTEYDIAQPLDFDAGGDCFNVGKCAVQLHIAGIMPGIRAIDPAPFDWDVQVIPTHPNGKVTGMGTYGFAVSANAQDPELAWDLVKTLLSPETQKAIALNYSGIPLLKSMADDPDLLALAPPPANIEAFIANGENGITPEYFPGDCGSLYAGQINSEITTAMEAAVRGMMSATEAFTIANENIQACLDETIE